MRKPLLIIFIFIVFCLIKATSQSIVINEVNINAINNNQAYFEWIELYNTSTTDTIDVKGWYLRTDINNKISAPLYGDDEIVCWASRNPGTMPYDIIQNQFPAVINSTKIAPGQFAILLDPTYNGLGYGDIDFPDSVIVLTVKTYLNLGGDGGSSSGNNGLLYNPEDVIMLYNSNPTDPLSILMDSVSWKGNSQTQDYSLQRDNDCIFRWHSAASLSNSGGYKKDTDNSLISNSSPGLQNYINTPLSITGDSVLCFGQLFKFSLITDSLACGDYSVKWNFGDPKIGNSNNIDSSGLTVYHSFSDTGKFLVSVYIKHGGFEGTAYKTIYVNPFPNLYLGNDTTICLGDSLFIKANNGISYLWNDSSSASSLLVKTAGNYYVTILNQNGCPASDTINIQNFSPYSVSLGNDTAICENNSITLSPANNFSTYLWSNNLTTSSISVSASGSYSVEVSDINGCKGFDTIAITVNPVPKFDLGSDTSFCGGNAIFINAPPGYIIYKWSNGATGDSIQITSTATYSLTAVDSNGCTAIDSISAEEMPLPVVSFMANNVCEGDEVMFSNLSTSGTYSWSFGDNNFSSAPNPVYTYSQAGSYAITLVVENNNGCVDSLQSTLLVYAKPVVEFQTNLIAGCVPLEIEFSDMSVNAEVYKWEFGDGKSSTDVNPVNIFNDAGLYSVSLTVTSLEGCISEINKDNFIEVYPAPKAGFEMDKNELSLTTPAVNLINTSLGGSLYYWYFSDGSIETNSNPFHTFGDTGLYIIKQLVENNYGCKDSIEDSIIVFEDYQFYVPTAFTPNKDGINEVFIPKGIGLDLYDYVFMIYNRWGDLMFYTNDITQGWDGTIMNKNTIAVDGVYAWKIKITDKDGFRFKTYKGYVNLIK